MRPYLPREAKKEKNNSKAKKISKINITEKIKPNIKMAQATISLDTMISAFPTFDGKRNTDIKTYLEEYELLATESKIPENLQVIIVKGKFVGPAKEAILENDDINSEKIFADFKNKTIKLFQKEINFERSQTEFMTLKQEGSQTIDDFVKKFNAAAMRYLKISGLSDKEGAKEFLNTVKLPKFLEQIRPDIAHQVRMQGPKDFDQAVKIAKQIEGAFSINNSEEINAIIKNDNKKEIYEAILAVSQKQKDTFESLRQEINALKLTESKSQLKMPKFCEICKFKGHMVDECWYNKKNKEQSMPPQQPQNQGQQLQSMNQQTMQMPVPGQFSQNWGPNNMQTSMPIPVPGQFSQNWGPNNIQPSMQMPVQGQFLPNWGTTNMQQPWHNNFPMWQQYPNFPDFQSHQRNNYNNYDRGNHHESYRENFRGEQKRRYPNRNNSNYQDKNNSRNRYQKN